MQVWTCLIQIVHSHSTGRRLTHNQNEITERHIIVRPVCVCAIWNLYIRGLREGSLRVEGICQVLELAGALGDAASTAQLTIAVVPGSATCCALARVAAVAC